MPAYRHSISLRRIELVGASVVQRFLHNRLQPSLKIYEDLKGGFAVASSDMRRDRGIGFCDSGNHPVGYPPTLARKSEQRRTAIVGVWPARHQALLLQLPGDECHAARGHESIEIYLGQCELAGRVPSKGGEHAVARQRDTELIANGAVVALNKIAQVQEPSPERFGAFVDVGLEPSDVGNQSGYAIRCHRQIKLSLLVENQGDHH